MAVAAETRILPRMTLLLVRRFTYDNADVSSRNFHGLDEDSIFSFCNIVIDN